MELRLIARNDVFPLERARAAGIGESELRRMLRDGRCHRLHHGWFSTRAPVDERDHHLLRVTALLEQYAGRAVASDASALLVLGLPTYEPDLSVVHLMRTSGGGKAHAKADLIVRPGIAGAASAGLGPSERAVHPAVAVALAGLADPRSYLVPADAALARRLVSTEQLHLGVDLIGRRPGIQRVRAAVAHCEPRHESPGESVAAHVLRLLGQRTVPQFTVPGTEHWTPGGRGYRADLRIEGTRVLVEFDGRGKYADARDLWEEKRREDRIRSLGWEVVRLTWADLHDPDRVRSLVADALSRASRSRRAG